MSTPQETVTQKPAPQGKSGTAEKYNHIKSVIAIMSGKGGVGKSSITGLLASGLNRAGYKVGILDADITGPSIPKLFGLHGPVQADDRGILPMESTTGIKVISMNLLLPEEAQAVIWRGPLISQAVHQLWGDVVWGDLDYLLIDLPPGTSDVSLTIMQSLPLNGIVMVTTPQSLSSLVVRKAVNMAQIVGVKIIGVIENMAHFISPDTGTRYDIFGTSHSEEVAASAQAPLLAQIPIDSAVADLCDQGLIEKVQFDALAGLFEKFFAAAGITEPPKLNPVNASQNKPGAKNEGKSKMIGMSDDELDLSVFSPVAQAIIIEKENMGHLPDPDLKGSYRGCCGDSMQIEIRHADDRIEDAKFSTDGCLATIAVGGMLTRLLKGKTLTEAGKIQPKEIIDALKGLPESHHHCAELAIRTLQHTLSNNG